MITSRAGLGPPARRFLGDHTRRIVEYIEGVAPLEFVTLKDLADALGVDLAGPKKVPPGGRRVRSPVTYLKQTIRAANQHLRRRQALLDDTGYLYLPNPPPAQACSICATTSSADLLPDFVECSASEVDESVYAANIFPGREIIGWICAVCLERASFMAWLRSRVGQEWEQQFKTYNDEARRRNLCDASGST